MSQRQQGDATILRSTNIHRGFNTPQGRIEVLKGIDLELTRGEMVAVLGVSGVGKTTLLHILGGLDRPDQGEVFFDDQPYSPLSETELAVFRNRHVGFVFQFHYLLAEFSALENIMMPLLIASKPHDEARRRAELLLSEVGPRRGEHRHGRGGLGGDSGRWPWTRNWSSPTNRRGIWIPKRAISCTGLFLT